MNATEIIIIAAQIIGGFVLLFLGGDWLVDGGVALARRFRISPLVIGMTIVAFGTSAPELLVSLISAIKGSSGIAVGNVVGSNIANIGLILGLTALIYPIDTDNSKVTANGLIMIVASVLLLVFSLSSGITRTEGFVLFACLILFTVISIKNGRTKRHDDDSLNSTDNKKIMKPVIALLLIILSCAMLSFGADLLVDGASAMAKALGVSDKVIGLTIVALGTSLPELAASVAAAVKKEMDISIGNIIGSNIFNILCVLGVSASIRPIMFDFAQYRADYIIMLLFAAALLLFISPWKRKGRLGRMAGILLFTAYAFYAFFLFK
ncbi:MAG: calcium/sodium antiporter [Bacteroidaceae bacterium]|nr:calcium/sodium antiporter [Bacteroidaceae bacterium]